MERELKIALIGDTGVGKTTFLASFFGNHQQGSFIERYGYSVAARDASVSNDLLTVFHGLENGVFPPGTAKRADYSFDVTYRGQAGAEKTLGREAIVRVTFLDYPGGWFSQSTETQTAAAREQTLRWLSEAHLGLVLLDGSRASKADGQAYVRKTLSQLNAELSKVTTTAQDGIPRQWIVAVTKADCLGEEITAAQIGERVRGWASEELRAFDLVFAGKRQIGTHFLLLSSAAVQNDARPDPRKWIGLSVITPFALKAVVADVFEALKKMPVTERTFIAKLANLLGLLRTRIVRKLPKKYRTIGELMLLSLEKLAPALMNEYDKRQLAKVASEVRLGWEQLMAQLETAEGKRAYANLGSNR